MLQDWVPSFLDEMNKVAKLVSDENVPYVRNTALGAVSGPVIRSAMNLIETGRVIPADKNPRRWLLANMAGGALAGGVLPSIRNRLNRTSRKQGPYAQ
jgi:hypothetical protein